MERKIIYSEPADYFPENIRKAYKLGEYAEQNQEPKQEQQQERQLELRQSGEGEQQQRGAKQWQI